jgi:hypothetical protein
MHYGVFASAQNHEWLSPHAARTRVVFDADFDAE